jgi:hypothetical protein
VIVDPGQQQIGEIQVVSVLHEPVTVAFDAHLRQLHHFRVATGMFHMLDELLTTSKDKLQVAGPPWKCHCPPCMSIALMVSRACNSARALR